MSRTPYNQLCLFEVPGSFVEQLTIIRPFVKKLIPFVQVLASLTRSQGKRTHSLHMIFSEYCKTYFGFSMNNSISSVTPQDLIAYYEATIPSHCLANRGTAKEYLHHHGLPSQQRTNPNE